MTPEGRVVLLDFGLTADLESLGRQTDVDRQVVGTVGHMSPEQAAGLSITPASDWYSVGVMLYEAMTGRLPFVRPARRGDRRQADAIPPRRRLRWSRACRRIWCASASRSSTEIRRRGRPAVP